MYNLNIFRALQVLVITLVISTTTLAQINNTRYGRYAGSSFTSGSYNSVYGGSSGQFTTTGSRNTYLGSHSGNRNASGNQNLFAGMYSGAYGNYGSANVYLGYASGYKNNGSNNTFVGTNSGLSSTNGSYNVLLGYKSGYENRAGNKNTFLGTFAGYKNTGEGNVFIGYQAGYDETGFNKLYIANTRENPLIYGDFNKQSVSIGKKYTGIWYTLYVDGNTYTTGSYISSDRRLKKEIKPMKGALARLQEIEGVTYEYEQARYKERNLPEGEQIGLLAQNVQEIFPDLVQEDEEGYLAVNYDGMIPVIIEALKEISREHRPAQSQEQVDLLMKENAVLQQRLAAIEQVLQQNNLTPSVTGLKGSLHQNRPNPVQGSSSIAYRTALQAQSVSIKVYNLEGQQVANFQNLSAGQGEVQLQSQQLPAGTYIYHLVVDGEAIDSKRMLVAQ